MRRTIDWRFWVFFSAALMISYFVYVGYAAVEDGRVKDDRIDALIESSQAKDAVALIERRAADRDRRVASRERQAIADKLDDLTEQYADLSDRYADLLRWLRANDIPVPPRFITEAERTSTPPQGPVQQPPSGTRDRTPNRNGNGQQNGNSGGNRPPRNDGPGNSENAPGHNKGKKPKKHKGGKGHKPRRAVIVPDPDEVVDMLASTVRV